MGQCFAKTDKNKDGRLSTAELTEAAIATLEKVIEQAERARERAEIIQVNLAKKK